MERGNYAKAAEGTVEYFRHIYMSDGVEAMVAELRKLFPNASTGKFVKLSRVVMYGVDKDGKPLEKPQHPNPKDMVSNYDQYRFMDRVYARYMNKME